jgi:hypothetical protein
VCRTVQRPAASHGMILAMVTTILVVLLILWVLGVTTAYTLGGFVHMLLVIAVVIVVLRFLSGRSPLGN